MSSGGDVILAVKKGTTWGTAVSVNNAGDKVLPINIQSLIAKPEQLVDNMLGFAYKKYIDNGNEAVQPTLGYNYRYTGALQRLLAYAIGGDSAAQVGATADYDHTMDVVAKPALFGTVAMNDGVGIREIPSFQPGGFVLRGQSGGFWEIEFTGIGDQVYYTGDGSLTNSSLSSATATSDILKASFGETEFLVNDESAGALSSPTDRVCPNAVELSFQRNLVPDFTACGGTSGGSAWHTQAPRHDGQLTATLKLDFPEFTSQQDIIDFRDGTYKKLSMTITGPATGEDSQTYTSTWSFPSAKIMDVETPTNGSGLIVQSVTFELTQADSAPTGMSGITDILRHVLRDQITTDYDA